MQIRLPNQIETEFFQIEDALYAEQFAEQNGKHVYCWKTIGNSNWLERGLSVSDVLGLVILPKGLPDQIEMPDDIEI